MRPRSFVQCYKHVVDEVTFRAVVDAACRQKAREEQETAEQGQLVQQADVRYSLQQAVEKCSELVEFAQAVEEAVQTGDLSIVQAKATTMRGAATGLLQLLKQLGGKHF